MDMEFVRPADVSWLQIPDRQVLATRAVSWSTGGSPTQWGGAFAKVPQRVPMLDWPSALFDDETSIH
jgi:hypothetical protein